jgi:urea transport system ATP-binding protein
MLDVVSLDLSYGASRCLRGVSIAAEPGKVTAVLGRNGVGKSSLLRAIMGLERVQGGSITWEGRDVTHMAPSERARAGMGYVPQGREIFPFLTVQENLETALAAAPRGSSVPSDVFDLFPILKQFLRRRGGDLSGGQQQQLAIGRVLVRDPKLLLLDEPTEGIQPNIVEEIENVIHTLRTQKQMAILLIEQFLDFAMGIADTCYVMEKGHIVVKASTKNLSPEIIKEHLSV